MVINEVLTTIPSWSSRILLPLATHCHAHYYLHSFHFIKCENLVVKQHQDRDAYSMALHCKHLQYGTALQALTVHHCTASAYSMATVLKVPTVRHSTASAYSTTPHCKCLQYDTTLQVPIVRHCTANSEFPQDRPARAQGQMLFCLGNIT